MAKRQFRYVEEGHGKDSLTFHEKMELLVDFDIHVGGYYVLTPVTKDEWDYLKRADERGEFNQGEYEQMCQEWKEGREK